MTKEQNKNKQNTNVIASISEAIPNKKIATAFSKPRNDAHSKKSRLGLLTQHVNKVAFTLAEVLITLGIIGVVAAMTIPTLIANTNSAKFRSQFKKTLSTLSQAGKMAQAQYEFSYDGVVDGCGTNPENDNPHNNRSMCALINGTLTGIKYLGDSPNDGDYEIHTRGDIVQDFVWYQLADGTLIGIISAKPSGGGNWGWGLVDVNGFALPNTEVQCTNENDTDNIARNVNNMDNYVMGHEELVVKPKSCTVKKITDIYPIYFYGSQAIPDSNAGQYVLNTTK